MINKQRLFDLTFSQLSDQFVSLRPSEGRPFEMIHQSGDHVRFERIRSSSFVQPAYSIHFNRFLPVFNEQLRRRSAMETAQRVVKLNTLSSSNPGVVDGVSEGACPIILIFDVQIMCGIVIGKVETRTFEGSRCFSVDSSPVCILLLLDDRHQRGVLNFTFRDSVKDFVNVAYWLPPKDLIIIGSKFSTGDVGRDIGQRMTYETLFDDLASFYPSSRGETQSWGTSSQLHAVDTFVDTFS